MKIRQLMVSALLLLSGRTAWAGMISAGQLHTCAWDGRAGEGPVCWGNNDHRQLEVPQITHLTSLGSGAWHSCAAYSAPNGRNSVACWGDSTFGQLNVPDEGRSVMQLSVGRWHSCAIYSSEQGEAAIRCWGKNHLGQRDVPPSLGAVQAVFAGSDFSCAYLGSGDVRCWGGLEGRFPAARFPNVTSSERFACRANGDNSVDCWTNVALRGQASMQLTTQLSSIPRRETLSCSLSQTSMRCASEHGAPLATSPLRNPVDLAVGDFHACVLDDAGVKCWGDNSEKQSEDPVRMARLRFGPRFASFADAPGFLGELSEFSYEFDERFLRGVQSIADRLGPQSAPFIMTALRGYLAGFGYVQVREAFLDRVVERLDALNQARGVRSLADSEASPILYECALRMLATSISTARNLFGDADRRKSELLVARLVDAYTQDAPLSVMELTDLEHFWNGLLLAPYLEERAAAAVGLVAYLRRAP